jgi:hypothetical protein
MSTLTQFFGGSSQGIPLRVLVQAAGGGGGEPTYGYGSGAGGAGGIGLTNSGYQVAPGTTCTITVGGGGAAATPSVPGTNGGFSAFSVPSDGKADSIRIEGGQGGGHTAGAAGSPIPGGCGAGQGGGPAGNPVSLYTDWSGDGIVTEAVFPWGVAYGNPGVGNGTLADSSGSTKGNRRGCKSYITGTLTFYGAGNTSPAIAPVANSGNGGGAPKQAGSPGVVVVQYPSTYGAASSSPGAVDVSPATPGFYTYRFTSSGSITLP